jgi:hypothetical protein
MRSLFFSFPNSVCECSCKSNAVIAFPKKGKVDWIPAGVYPALTCPDPSGMRSTMLIPCSFFGGSVNNTVLYLH